MEKWHIAICDDEAPQRLLTENMLQKWAVAKGQQLRIDQYSSAESFLFAFEDQKDYDLLILDIKMQDVDGMELARQVRRQSDGIQFIFITGFTDYMPDGYEVGALHYLIKPVEYEQLAAVLDRALAGRAVTEREVLLETENGILRIPESRVLCAEAFGHDSAVTMEQGDGKRESCTVRLPISKLHEVLGTSFIFCHRSYLVNLARVEGITKTDVVLEGGLKLPLSRRLYTAVNQQFIQYHRTQGGGHETI